MKERSCASSHHQVCQAHCYLEKKQEDEKNCFYLRKNLTVSSAGIRGMSCLSCISVASLRSGIFFKKYLSQVEFLIVLFEATGEHNTVKKTRHSASFFFRQLKMCFFENGPGTVKIFTWPKKY